MGLSFGSDPEFLIVDRDMHPQSAIKVFPGHGKEAKIPIGDQAIFYDNVLLEFNLKPARNLLEFSANFRECLSGTSKILKRKNLYLSTTASLAFPEDQCEDDEACIFGCDPEFCIYNRTEDGKIMRVDPPLLPEGDTFRSCGGHIHIGHAIANWESGGDPATVIQLMDGFVGVVSLLIDKDMSSAARKQLYGGAGTHRVTPYGVEYRTLSNFWFSDPRLTEIVYKLTRLVVEKALTNPRLMDNLIDPVDLQRLINKGKLDEAYKFYDANLRKHIPFELQKWIESLLHSSHHSLLQEQWDITQSLAA